MLALHSSDFVMFFSGFLLACTRVQIPGTSVCLLYSKHGRSFPYRPQRHCETAYQMFVFTLGLPVGPADKQSVISGKII